MKNSKTNKKKKVIGIIVDVIVWLFVIFAIFTTVLAVSAGTNDKKIPTIGNKAFFNVQSNSMKADKPDWAEEKPKGFSKGDLLIGEYVYGNNDRIFQLEKGDIITFAFDRDGDGIKEAYNSHRIVEVVKDSSGRVLYFKQQGDNHEMSPNAGDVYASDIVAVYTGHKIKFVGVMIDIVRSELGFILTIILPLGLFFIYELVVFIRTFTKVKNEGKKMITAEDEEAIKQRAIEEYIRLQGGVTPAAATSPDEKQEENENTGETKTDN